MFKLGIEIILQVLWIFEENNYLKTGHCCVYDTVECLIEPYGFFYSYCSCLSRQSGPVLELVQCESFSNKPQDKLTTKVVDLGKCL